jgi:AraC-like DNA-binding protein
VVENFVDGPLGRWTHIGCRPAHLAGLVEGIWIFDGWLTTLRERTFPNGMLEIFVHLGDRYRVVEDRGVPQDWVCPTTCVTGLQLGHLIVQAPAGRTKVLGIKLTPEGAYALFARPMPEVARLTVDLEDLAGAAAAELAEECHSSASAEACIRTVVRWIDRRLAQGIRLDPAVAWVVAEIHRRHGGVSIAALRERTGLSKSRLASTFLAQVGVSPKQFARVIRFRRVLTQLHAAPLPLSGLALDSGYYDQPHMNAEFKALSGYTPVEFLQATRYPRSVSVAER